MKEILLSMCCSNLCCAASGSPYILCVCLYVVFLFCVRAIYVYPRSADLYISHCLLVSFAGVHFNMNCMNVHVLKTL